MTDQTARSTPQCTCSALRMAARRLTQLYDSALAPSGLSTAQFALLGNLSRWSGTPTVNALADRMALDRTTLAHNLRPLEREGLVMVTVDSVDRRVRRIALTPAGAGRHRSAEPLWLKAQAEFDAAYGAERSRDLRAAVLAVTESVGRTLPNAQTQDPAHAG